MTETEQASMHSMDVSLFKIGEVEQWVERSELPVKALREPNDSPLYFFHLSYQDRIAEDRIDRYNRRVYQINDESQVEDQAQSLYDLWPESETITFHRCVIYRAGSTIDCLDLERIRALQRDTGLENHCVSDKLTVELLIDDLRVGDVVDLESTQTEYAGSHMLHGRFYLSSTRLEWGVPIRDMLVRYVNQSDKDIKIQHLHTDKKINDVSELPAGDNYTHHLTNREPVQGVNHLPYWYWPEYLLATTTNSWPDVSSYIFQQNQQRNVLDTKIDPSLIEEIEGIDWQSNSKENVTAIVRFVQDNIRYRAESNGIHSHTPKSVTETLRRRTGDCKDKSALLVVLLKKVGIDASLALVNTSMMDDVKSVQPSAYWFNHMVVRFFLNNKAYLIDATLQKQGGDIESQARLSFGVYLPIEQAGSDLVAVDYNNDLLLYEETVNIDLRHQLLNECTMDIERCYYQERADNVRYQVAAHEKNYYENHFLEVAQDYVQMDLSVLEPYQIQSDDKQMNCIRTTEKYRLQGDITQHEDGLLYFSSTAHDDFLMPKRDTHPVATTSPGRSRYNINVLYGNSPSTVKENFELKTDWFSYHDTMKNEGASIVCVTDFTGHTNSIAAENVAACREAVGKVQKRSRTQVPLKLDLEVKTGVSDHLWYLGPLAYWLAFQGAKRAGLLESPFVLMAFTVPVIFYLAYIVRRRGWFSADKK